jgi:hypothetical protein
VKQKKERKFISIYFNDGFTINRKKRDLTLAFDSNDPIYHKCKGLGSTKIKEIIGIPSYEDLMLKAKKENRSLNNYIKHKLNLSLLK